jgi:hypothetical protein
VVTPNILQCYLVLQLNDLGIILILVLQFLQHIDNLLTVQAHVLLLGFSQ